MSDAIPRFEDPTINEIWVKLQFAIKLYYMREGDFTTENYDDLPKKRFVDEITAVIDKLKHYMLYIRKSRTFHVHWRLLDLGIAFYDNNLADLYSIAELLERTFKAMLYVEDEINEMRQNNGSSH